MTKNESFADQLSAMIKRLAINEEQAADYLGVPMTTLKKWLKGQRVPSAAVVRLVEVLGLLEALAPSIHEALISSTQKEKSND